MCVCESLGSVGRTGSNPFPAFPGGGGGVSHLGPELLKSVLVATGLLGPAVENITVMVSVLTELLVRCCVCVCGGGGMTFVIGQN